MTQKTYQFTKEELKDALVELEKLVKYNEQDADNPSDLNTKWQNGEARGEEYAYRFAIEFLKKRFGI